jgi:hypothetical protein
MINEASSARFSPGFTAADIDKKGFGDRRVRIRAGIHWGLKLTRVEKLAQCVGLRLVAALHTLPKLLGEEASGIEDRTISTIRSFSSSRSLRASSAFKP